MIDIFVPFCASLALNFFLIYYAHKKNLFIDCHESDKPQRFHDMPTPRVGGLGIFIASIFAVYYYFGVLLAIAATIAFFSGIVEDFTGRLSQKSRLVLQSFAAFVFVVIGGVYLKTIGLGLEFPYILALFFTVFAIVGVTNSVNIIDGLNGLASGVSIAALSIFALFAYILGDVQILYLCLSLIAATIGFFVFNFPKGKLFLGDGGAYYLGFMLAAMSILIVYRHPEVSAWFCLSVVIYPVWEVIFSILRRRKALGKRATEPDKMHLHQVLMRSRKLSNPVTAAIIVVSFLPFQIAALFFYSSGYLLFGLILIFILFYQRVYFGLLKKKR